MARAQGREPTGELREYPPQQVFFSTTDGRGVIETVNSTFVRLSRFGELELIGAPHSIVRHPDMPGGVFHLMWETIRAGRSMAAYVVNLAADGAHYRTFSTVTPLGDGFISVRSAVTRHDLFGPVARAYEETRAFERAQRANGLSRAEAAAKGAEDLTHRLARLGFSSYDDVMRALLPAEVDERRRLAPPAVPSTWEGQPLHPVVTGLVAIDAELAALRHRYDAAAAVADELAAARAALDSTLTELASASASAASASSAVASDAPILASTARAAVTLADQLHDELRPLADLLTRVSDAIRDLRATLALSVLHNDMAMIFAGEVAAGETYGRPMRSVVDIAHTVERSTSEGSQLRRDVAHGLGAIADAVAHAQQELMGFQRLLTNWRNLVARSGVGGRIGPALNAVDERLRGGVAEMTALAELGDRCRELATPASTERLDAAASAVVAAARELATA